MKILTLIVHTNVQQELSDRLRSMDKVSGFTFTHVEGHGDDIEKDGFLSARDEVVGYIPSILLKNVGSLSHVLGCRGLKINNEMSIWLRYTFITL